jgi:hypothetical protein
MQPEEKRTDGKTANLCDFKERLRAKLPRDSPVLSDLLLEPDSIPFEKAEVLILHYLQRLERELEKYETSGPLVLHP